MPSDAFIGVLTGLGEAHRARQKNIFDQEVARRSKYEQFLQKASTDPTYRPEAQDQFSQLYSTLIMTPPEKKLPKDFERQVTDALTSVEGSMDLRQGGPPEQASTPGPIPQSQPIQPPEPFQGKMSSRISPQEVAAQKIRESVQMLQALGPIQMQQALEQKRGELALEPPRVGSFPPESGIWEQDPVTRKTTVIREPELKPVKPPNLTNLSPEWIVISGRKEPVQVLRQLDPADPSTVGKVFERTAQGLREVTEPFKPYDKPSEGAKGSFLPYTDKRGVVQGWVNPTTKQVVRPGDLGVSDDLFRGPMAMDRQTREEAAVSGLKAITRFRQELAKNPNMLTQLAIPGSPGARIARAARGEMVDVLTRIRTGAALNDNEEIFYNQQAPGLLDALLDEPEAIEYKLSIFEDQFKALAPPASKSAAPTPPPSAGAGDLRREQFSPSTKQYRHTLDGGKTWLSGRLPK